MSALTRGCDSNHMDVCQSRGSTSSCALDTGLRDRNHAQGVWKVNRGFAAWGCTGPNQNLSPTTSAHSDSFCDHAVGRKTDYTANRGARVDEQRKARKTKWRRRNATTRTSLGESGAKSWSTWAARAAQSNGANPLISAVKILAQHTHYHHADVAMIT